MTVKSLAKITYTSESSIRRDLAALEKKHLVHRTHGGASLADLIDRVPSLNSRMNQNTAAKRLIAQKAAVYLSEGQTILLDGSTTAAFLLPHIAKYKTVTLYTNSLLTALSAIELGIHTHVLGGSSKNGSAALTGEETYRALEKLTADILFFSSQALDADGIISDSNAEENYLRERMLAHARMSVFLCDKSKRGIRATYTLSTLEQIDRAVFDTDETP